MASAANWWQFTKERFDPVSHLVMIVIFVAAHRLLFGLNASFFTVALILLGTTAFFFKLRLYDEIKDYELDLVINPTRPLARGLVKHADLYRGIVLCIVIELACFGAGGRPGLAAIVIAIAYSLLMFREFFIRELIRPHLTTYAVSHTVVSGMLTLALISALSQTYPWDLPISAILFALNSWCLFNIFEFGRKTFTSSEERSGVESYSKIFGRFGAVLLVIAMTAGSAYCLVNLETSANAKLMTLSCSIALFAVGVLYSLINRSPWGKIYRAFSSIYIVLIYSGLCIIHSWPIGRL